MVLDIWEQCLQCPCCKLCKDCKSFRDFLNLKDTGLVIYQLNNSKKGAFRNDTCNITEDVFIVHNTKHVQIISADQMPAIDKNNINCLHCKNIIDRVEKLLQNIPTVEKNSILGVCKNCLFKARSRTLGYDYERNLKKYISDGNLKEESWISKIKNLLKDTRSDNNTRTSKKLSSKYVSHKMHNVETGLLTEDMPITTFKELQEHFKSNILQDLKITKGNLLPENKFKHKKQHYMGTNKLKLMFSPELHRYIAQESSNVSSYIQPQQVKISEGLEKQVKSKIHDETLSSKHDKGSLFSEHLSSKFYKGGKKPTMQVLKERISQETIVDVSDLHREQKPGSDFLDSRKYLTPEFLEHEKNTIEESTRTKIHQSFSQIKKYNLDEDLIHLDADAMESTQKDFSYYFPKEIVVKKGLKHMKSSCELILEIKKMLLAREEEQKRKNEEVRLRRLQKQNARGQKKGLIDEKMRNEEESATKTKDKDSTKPEMESGKVQKGKGEEPIKLQKQTGEKESSKKEKKHQMYEKLKEKEPKELTGEKNEELHKGTELKQTKTEDQGIKIDMTENLKIKEVKQSPNDSLDYKKAESNKTEAKKLDDKVKRSGAVDRKKEEELKSISKKEAKPIVKLGPEKGKPVPHKKEVPTIQLKQPGLKSAVQEASKGSIRYVLSDRTFIDKGWTMLPTEKVIRKMNIYRMYPAHPEFDWFEHNKDKQLIFYDCGEKLVEFDDTGHCRWFYRNGRIALEYYEAEETNVQQRIIVYSSGEPEKCGQAHPLRILASFDYLGNGVVFDHGGKIRLKYNQTEGIVLDRSIGPVSHWKWHTLNDPPILQKVMIDTQMLNKDPEILKIGGLTNDPVHPNNEEMMAIEYDNFIKENSTKLSQTFKPFQIKMKALKINEYFSLKVLDQATIYLIFRDGTTNIKLNIGMILDNKEILDTDTADVGDVSNNLERFPARTESLAGLQRSIACAQRCERLRTEREHRINPIVDCASVDILTATASHPLRPPFEICFSDTLNCKCIQKSFVTKLCCNTRLI